MGHAKHTMDCLNNIILKGGLFPKIISLLHIVLVKISTKVSEQI